jgi:hypothetical protein
LETSLLGDHSEREPPDPIPNSEVKPLSVDDSVAVCHAKVENCQALIFTIKPKIKRFWAFLFVLKGKFGYHVGFILSIFGIML